MYKQKHTARSYPLSCRVIMLSMLLVFSLFFSFICIPYMAWGSKPFITSSANNISNISPVNKNSTTTTSIANQTTRFLTYENTTLGFRLLYPSNWRSVPTGQGIIIESPLENSQDTYRENLRVSVSHFNPKNGTLDGAVRSDVNFLNKYFRNFDLVQYSSSKIGNATAKQLIYTGLLLGRIPHIITGQKIFTAKNDRLYIITYEADLGKYSTYHPTIQKMINSFYITK